MTTQLIADMGFEAAYLSGTGVTNMFLGVPDMGFVGLRDMVDHTGRIREVSGLPLIVDADTGYGNAQNVYYAVRALERAGANAIQIEDQVSPKKCGHFDGKAVIPTAEMVGKIPSALDARENHDTLIIARTDAYAIDGFEAAWERSYRFAEAGADVLFVEAITNSDQIQNLPKLLPKPALINIVTGGKTPTLSQYQLAALRYGIVLYANAALQGAVFGLQQGLRQLQAA